MSIWVKPIWQVRCVRRYRSCEGIQACIFPSLQRRGGRAIKKWSRSEKARTGWSLASDVSECVLKHLRVSDHPVCGASVASRLFINAAATPPLQGGECAQTERFANSFAGTDSSVTSH